MTAAQLDSQIASTLTAISAGQGSQKYKIGSRSLQRAPLQDLMAWLSALSAEKSRRADTTGGVGVVSFGNAT